MYVTQQQTADGEQDDEALTTLPSLLCQLHKDKSCHRPKSIAYCSV